MSKATIIYVSEPVFRTTIIFSVHPSEEIAHKDVKKHHADILPNDFFDWNNDYYDGNQGATCAIQRGQAVIWLPRYDRSGLRNGQLTHEIQHVVSAFLCSHIGIPHVNDSDEAFSYLMQFYTRTFIDAWYNTPQKKK